MQSRNPKYNFICFLLFAIVGAIFAGVGSVMMIVTAASHSKCTTEAPAVVVEMRTSRSTHKGRVSITYAPVLDYEYHNEKFTYTSNIFTNPPKYKKGQHVTVMLNPDNPNELYILGDSTSYILFGFFIGIGALTCIIGVVGLVKTGSIRRRFRG